jgi:hypothetical protein
MTTKKEINRRMNQSHALESLGLDWDEAETLRRASMTLRRWGEMECNCDVERIDGKVMIRYSSEQRKPVCIRDRETPALARCEAIAKRRGLVFYHQSDPRGAAVYIGKPESIPEGKALESYYTRLVCVY